MYEIGKKSYEIGKPLYESGVLGTYVGETAIALGSLFLLYKGRKQLSKRIKTVAEKTKDSPIVHPIRVRRERRAKEDEMLVNLFKSHKIKTNETRPSSCLFQYDRKTCLEKAKSTEQKEEFKSEGG